MTKEEFIGKLQMVYIGDKNALNECTQEYLGLREVINKFLDIVDKSKMLLNNPDLLDLYLKIKEVSE